MNTQSNDNPGVIAHPPFIYLGGLVAGMLLEAAWPLGAGLFNAGWPQVNLGILGVLTGAGLLAIAARLFVRAGTNIPTHRPSTALVTDGIYRWSRNPIYVALTTIYTGLALALGAWWALIVLPIVLAVMRYGVIAREEAYLEDKFGGAYAEYKKQVRRWL